MKTLYTPSVGEPTVRHLSGWFLHEWRRWGVHSPLQVSHKQQHGPSLHPRELQGTKHLGSLSAAPAAIASFCCSSRGWLWSRWPNCKQPWEAHTDRVPWKFHLQLNKRSVEWLTKERNRLHVCPSHIVYVSPWRKTCFSSSSLSNVAQTSHKSRSCRDCCSQTPGHRSSAIIFFFFLAAHVGISMNFLFKCETLQLSRQERCPPPPPPAHVWFTCQSLKKLDSSSEGWRLFSLASAARLVKLQI